MLAGRSVFAGFRSKAGRFGCSAATASRVGARPGVRRLARAAIPERVKPSDHSSSPFHELGLFDIWDGLGTTRARQHVNPLRAEFQSPIGPVDWSQVYEDPTRPLVLDLGCGPGRFLLLLNHKSMPADDVIKAAGGANYLGIEIRRSMVERSNIWAERMGVHKTCCFLYTNATVSLKDALATYPGALHSCYIQFPDPHFKKRYHKRRIFQPNLIKTLKDALPVGGRLFLQSDVLKVSVAMRNMFEYYAADAFALAPEHVPTDPSVVFYQEPGQGDGETDAPTRSPIPSSSTPTARLEAAVLASDSHVNTAWRSESSEGAEGSDVDGSDGSEGSKGSEGSNGSEELDQDRSDEEDSPCRLPRRVREADTDNIVSEWSKGGWLVDNPIGVPTEREVYVGQQGMPVYRILLERK